MRHLFEKVDSAGIINGCGRVIAGGRGYQDSLYPGILVSLRAKRSNLPHFEIASAQSASQ